MKQSTKDLIIAVIIGLLLAIVFWVIILYSVGREEPEAVPATDQSSPMLYLGDPVIAENTEVTPLRVERVAQEKSLTDIEGQLVKVTFKFEQDGFEPSMFVTEDFSLLVKGKKITPFWQVDDENSAFSIYLNEKEIKTAYAYYEVPKEFKVGYIQMKAKPVSKEVKGLWQFEYSELQEPVVLKVSKEKPRVTQF